MIRELDRQEGMPGEDVGLDHRRRRCSRRCCDRLGDESASAVVLDCRNGEVLAMATNPSFDPSLFNCRRVAGAVGGVDAATSARR